MKKLLAGWKYYKRILSVGLVALVVTISLLPPVPARAVEDTPWISDYDVSVDGSKLYLKKYIGSETDLILDTSTVVYKGRSYSIDYKTEGGIDSPSPWAGNTTIKSITFENSFPLGGTTNVGGAVYSKSMTRFFQGCTALETVDLSGANTSNVITMGGLFSGCTALKEVKFGNINTSMLSDFSGVFYGCDSIEEIDLSGLNLRVGSIAGLFSGCKALKEINFGTCFSTAKLEDISFTFQDCESLEKLDLSWLDTEFMKYCSGMFSGCKSLKKLDLSMFNTKLACQYEHAGSYKAFSDMFAGMDLA